MLLAASESAVTKKSQIALDQPALVVGQPVRVLPQRDVARHVHFLRHPVIGAGRQILFPGPLVLERDQLVDVGPAVDDRLSATLTRRSSAPLPPCTPRPPGSRFRASPAPSPALDLTAVWRFPPRPARSLAGLAVGESRIAGLQRASGRPAAPPASASVGTAFSCPVLVVDFSACVAPTVRR